ncbi:glucosaminidase domain-containing protein [Listeria sp. PSOL-1]|uniref:glucosaminidase domain-containing protein n=1 Tax=Listeria sp. PSOL-1 TaxID=1844999 RepID=UPI0018DA1FFE|nr:glucosaminidase domain-containing protein [Listeria sp. PSOL-1]
MKRILVFTVALFLSLTLTGGISLKAEANSVNTDALTSNADIGPGYYMENGKLRTKRDTNPSQFLSEIKEGAIQGWKEYQVIPSITAAQAILESGWGDLNYLKTQIIFLVLKGNIMANML